MPKSKKTGSPNHQQRKKQAKRKGRERRIKKGDHQPQSDNVRRYRAIRVALQKLYPGEAKGNLVRHLNTLAALISGIVGRKVPIYPRWQRKYL